MINYETLISSYDDKLTLMQWLKKVEDALKNSVLTSVSTVQEGEEVTFTFSFEDGTKIISSPVKVNQQVDNAYILNGHLFIHLADGEEIDAGNLFEGNVQMDGELTASGLKATGTGVETGVLKTNGTALDVFATEVNINTDVFAQGSLESETLVKTPVLTSDEDTINAQKPILQPSGILNAVLVPTSGLTKEVVYIGSERNGNKITFVVALNLTRRGDIDAYNVQLVSLEISSVIGSNLIPSQIGSYSFLDVRTITAFLDHTSGVIQYSNIMKVNNNNITFNTSRTNLMNLQLDTKYYYRYEATFLLSESVA